MNQLKLEDLSVKIEEETILSNINLEINKGDTVLIVGPNGHGKSTLLKSVLKHYDTEISGGKIIIDNEVVNELSTDEIAQKGIYLASQYPVEIPGLNMLDLIRTEINQDQRVSMTSLYQILNKKMKSLKMNNDLLKRSINENFSGGERKKNEILQMEIINPDFIFLDEIDSGLDVDAIHSISESLINQQKQNKAIVYISHNDKLLLNLIPNKVVVMMNGTIVKTGNFELAKQINQNGYEWLAKELGIELKINNEESFDFDDTLSQTLKGFSCGTK